MKSSSVKWVPLFARYILLASSRTTALASFVCAHGCVNIFTHILTTHSHEWARHLSVYSFCHYEHAFTHKHTHAVVIPNSHSEVRTAQVTVLGAGGHCTHEWVTGAGTSAVGLLPLWKRPRDPPPYPSCEMTVEAVHIWEINQHQTLSPPEPWSWSPSVCRTVRKSNFCCSEATCLWTFGTAIWMDPHTLLPLREWTFSCFVTCFAKYQSRFFWQCILHSSCLKMMDIIARKIPGKPRQR